MSEELVLERTQLTRESRTSRRHPLPNRLRAVAYRLAGFNSFASHRTFSPSVSAVWGSGRQMRDFIHVDDCIRGVLTMMDRIEDGSAVNLSTGILTSFTDLAAMAAELAGWRPAVRGLAGQPEGVFARGGDTRLQESLGFRAAIPLPEGLARALAHLDRAGP